MSRKWLVSGEREIRKVGNKKGRRGQHSEEVDLENTSYERWVVNGSPPPIVTALADLRLRAGTPVLMLLRRSGSEPTEWLATSLSARPTRPGVCIRGARGHHMPGVHSRIVLVRVLVVATMSTIRTRGILGLGRRGLGVLLLRGRRGAESDLWWSPLLWLLGSLLVWRLGALLCVLRGRRDGECWRDGSIGGVRGCGCAGIASVGAGTRASTGGGGSASSALLARIGGAIVSNVVVIGFTFVLLDTAGGWVAADREAAG